MLGEERRGRVLELAHAHGTFVIEDEWVRDLHLDGTPPPAWPRHLRRLRLALAARRDALIAALAEELPSLRLFARPRGGLSVWLRLPDGADEARLVQAAAVEGVLVIPGAPWFPAEPSGPHVRMSFAAASEDRLREAVARLARAAAAAGAH